MHDAAHHLPSQILHALFPLLLCAEGLLLFCPSRELDELPLQRPGRLLFRSSQLLLEGCDGEDKMLTLPSSLRAPHEQRPHTEGRTELRRLEHPRRALEACQLLHVRHVAVPGIHPL